jgi:hypothetical protein
MSKFQNKGDTLMSTKRHFMIMAVGAAIVVLIGIGTFIFYDMNAPGQPEKVYKLPDTRDRRPAVAQATTVKTEAVAFGQQGRTFDNTTVPHSHESDSHDASTTVQGKTVIEPCCPEDEELTNIGTGQDSNLDSNPVTPELAADMKRDAEWFVAKKAWEKTFDAHYAEGKRLEEEHKALRPVDPEEFLRTGDRQALVAKLKASRAKLDAWWEKLEKLKREKPVQPTPTHKH